MNSEEIRERFLKFFEARGHKVRPSSSLVPSDPSVLLTTAGMQQFKEYYLKPEAADQDFGGRSVVSIQKCFRTSDIDEVGDERHLTFFEMLGNFSFGGYFKDQAIKLAYEFITKELGIKIDYVTIFEGDPPVGGRVGKDEESRKIWQSLGVTEIRECGRADNFWGPTGSEGPCGPTSEIYAGGIEIWNLVFNEYYQSADGRLEKLSTPGVDTGMGLERLAMVVQRKSNVFETDLFGELGANRILADHARAIAFLFADGIRPENKGAGYILRRLLRRLLVKIDLEQIKSAVDFVIKKYSGSYPELKSVNIFELIEQESNQFSQTMKLGLKELDKVIKLDGVTAFGISSTLGIPFEVMKDKHPELSRTEFEAEFAKHQTISRAGLEKKFAGGLANHEPKTVKLHTAHHLLLAALQTLFGKQIKQRGSNINEERLRLDFAFDRKLTDEEKKKLEEIVNEKIREDLPVVRREMPKSEAEKLGAEMEFGKKYGDTVSVYSISPSTGSGQAFSLEFCGGPHVSKTGELGHFKILKDEAVAQGVRRIKATLD
ncbi:MAG: alanine--tRNA ligase-related protein [Patescibacteria group bacterium]